MLQEEVLDTLEVLCRNTPADNLKTHEESARTDHQWTEILNKYSRLSKQYKFITLKLRH